MERITIMRHDGPCGADCDKTAVPVQYVRVDEVARTVIRYSVGLIVLGLLLLGAAWVL